MKILLIFPIGPEVVQAQPMKELKLDQAMGPKLGLYCLNCELDIYLN